MKTDELLASLEELEKNLKDLESAKELVRKTMKAHNSVINSVSDYSLVLDKINITLNNITDQISKYNGQLSSDAENIATVFKNSCDKSILKLQKANDTTISNLKNTSDEISLFIKEKLDNSTVSFTKGVDNVLTKTKDKLATLQTSISQLEEIVNSIQNFESLEALINDIVNCVKGIEESFIKNQTENSKSLKEINISIQGLKDTLAQHIDELKAQIDIINDTHKQLNNAINDLNLNQQNDIKQLEKAIKEIDDKCAVLNEIDIKTNKLNDIFENSYKIIDIERKCDDIIDENKNVKKEMRLIKLYAIISTFSILFILLIRYRDIIKFFNL